MIVIAKRNTTKIVKGCRYEVHSLYNSLTSRRKYVFLLGFGRYNVDNFTDTNGNPLPQTDIVPKSVPVERLLFAELKKGDILVCKSDRYKTMIEGAKYKIEELKIKEIEFTGWNGTKGIRKEEKVKFEGVKRTLGFNSWCFRKLNSEEIREISLSSILEGKEPEIVKTDKLRKIDHTDDKDKELILYLSKAIFDRNRHHLTITEWASKLGNKMGITPSDYDHLLEMPLKDILSNFETK